MSKVSAVICSRNDNYGGNLPLRALACLNSMVQTMDEVIYVDWNSPGESLLDDIKPHIHRTGKLKHIKVDSAQARGLVPDENAQDCCEVMARNIGIRRATGDFIVSTNIDIIPTPLYVSGLSEVKFYVAPRRDIENWQDIMTGYAFLAPMKPVVTYKELLDTLQKKDLPRKPHASDGHSVVVCCGDFQMASRSAWWQIRGFEESMIYRAFADTNVLVKAKLAGIDPTWFDYDFYHLNHYDAGYQRMHQAKPLNDKHHYIDNFKQTSNSELWGCASIDFPVEVL